MKKSRQWELWQECHNHCTFCYLKDENRHTPDSLKINALNNAIKDIKALNYDEYDTVSFIGGEMFQGEMSNPEVNEKFFELMKVTADLVKQKKITTVWMAATLTKGDQKDLYKVLDMFKTMKNKDNTGFWIITSYDIKGRFHTKEMHDTWEFHMSNIHKNYPKVKFNTTLILTGDLIDKYMEGTFTFNDFCEKYNTSVFLKQPSPAASGNANEIDYLKEKEAFQQKVPNFFVTREKFLRFLGRLNNQEPGTYDKLFNIQYRADDLFRNYNREEDQMILNKRLKDGTKIEFDETTIDVCANKCGHPMDYTPYIDSNACCLCDKLMISDE